MIASFIVEGPGNVAKPFVDKLIQSSTGLGGFVDSDVRENLSEWFKFLLEAGIPASQAASYAVSFVDNRIERNMLGDLDKDYLKELGITVLGDIIAILKHAKKVATKESKVKPAAIQMVRTEDGLKKTTPASRLVDHFLKASGSESNQNSRQNSPRPMASEASTEEEASASDYSSGSTQRRKKLQMKRSKLKSIKVTNKLISSELPSSTTSASTAPRRRVAAPITNATSNKLEVPVPKSRRVLPEHEGGYKIKMPAGTTPKTAKLMAEGKLSSAKATKTKTAAPSTMSGIFSRLGTSSDVDTVTPVRKKVGTQAAVGLPSKSSIIQAQKKADNTISFTVTGFGKVDPNNILSSMKEPGVTEKAVFKRLGGSAEPGRRAAVKRAATSTQPDECEPIARDAAPYIGVLKDGGVHAKSPKRLKIAVGAKSGSGFAVSRLVTDSVKSRLGSTPSPSEVAPKITRTLVRPSASKTVASSSIKRRLGATTLAESAVSSSTDDVTNIKITRKISTTTGGGRRKSAGSAAPGVFSRLGRR